MISSYGDYSLDNVSSVTNSSDYYMSYDSDYIATLYNMAKHTVYPELHEYFLIAAYAAIFLLALVGNLMVCIAILSNEHMRTVTNYYIMNLAATDILIALVVLPTTVTVDITTTWFFGEIGCCIFPYLQVVLICVSIYTLMMIAVDRYLAICHPLTFQIRASRTMITIAIVWLTSFLVALPLAFAHQIEGSLVGPVIGKPLWLTKCDEFRWMGSVWQKVYHTSFFFVGYVVPLTVIGIAYALVCIRLWSGIPTEEGCGASKPSFQNSVVTTRSVSVSKSTEALLQSRRKVATMLIVVVVAFAICFFPFQLINLLKHHNAFESVVANNVNANVVHVPFLIAHLMSYTNSAINPIIYRFMSAKFRQAFKSTFECRQCGASKKEGVNKRPGPPYRRANSTGVSDTHTTEYVPMTSLRNARPADQRTEHIGRIITGIEKRRVLNDYHYT